MISSKKFLIITSNEEIIRQFTSHGIKDTRIIDLDNDRQLLSTSNNNNNNIVVNLSSLSQLTELDSQNDQIYKRALDSSDHDDNHQFKSNKIEKKSNNYTCEICDDHAVGYNYNVLSCAPCKVFFRRNANQDLNTMRCLTGNHQCPLSYLIRRKCTRCRLERCFTVGMKKEFLLTEEEIQNRKKRSDQNQINSSNNINQSQLTLLTLNENNHISTDMDTSLNTESERNNLLSEEDYLTIENLRSSFVSIFGEDREQCACFDVTDQTSALISCSEFIQKLALRFINYFRQIEQFEKLDIDDRLILIKYNFLSISLISKCFYYQPTNDCCSNDNSEIAIKHRRFFLLFDGTLESRNLFIDMIVSLVNLTKQDLTVLTLFANILMFSRGLSMHQNEPILKNSLDVHQSQSYFIEILWKYLVKQFGEFQSIKYYSQLLTIIFKIQSYNNKLRECFQYDITNSDAFERVAPIFKSVLNIS